MSEIEVSSLIGSINRATDAGDYTSALSSLRRFYDYQFPNTGRYACLTG